MSYAADIFQSDEKAHNDYINTLFSEEVYGNNNPYSALFLNLIR